VDLMQRHGLRVGVMATSHKAIVNFLGAVDRWATNKSYVFRGWKKAHDEADNNYKSDRITSSANRPRELTCSSSRPQRGGGPADEHESVDVLLIDEAGQVSLADAIAVSQGAKSTVLLGDPQQLAHVSQGTHLHGSGASVLRHLLGGENTIPRDRGVFLDRSWRMHPRSAHSCRTRCTTACCIRPRRARCRPSRRPAYRARACGCWASSTPTTARRRPRKQP
jgi:hypothetical protein